MPLPDPDSSTRVAAAINLLIAEGYGHEQATTSAMEHCHTKSLEAGATRQKAGSVQSVGEREAVFIASTNAVDRVGDIVEQDWELRNFRKNPVFLFQHQSSSLPIGKVDRVWTEDTGKDKQATYAHVSALPEGMDDFADKVWRFVKGGFLNAVSVGFTALTTPEPRYDKEGMWLGFVFPRNELTELSLVSVPANQEALAIARSLDMGEKDLKRMFVERKGLSAHAHARAAQRYAEIERLRVSR